MQNGENHKFIVNPMPLAQRQYGAEGFELDDKTARRINEARGGGQPLDGALQEQMGASLGHDFSEVRVHTGAEADELNCQFSARAFTIGSDIFFQRDAYDPDSISGRELIAHELIHVVQQGNGRLSGEGNRMTVRPPGDDFEQEAEALAPIASGMDSPMHLAGTMSTLSAEPVVVQRALKDRTANINNYPPGKAQFPKTCLGVVLYWLCFQALDRAPTTAEMLQACEEDVQSFMYSLSTKWSASKRSRQRSGDAIIVVAGSVLFFRTSGKVAHACVMGDGGAGLSLRGVNQGGWWTGGHMGACPMFGLCSHNPSEINWSGWYHASVFAKNADHSVYTLPGEKAVNAVEKNLELEID